MPFYSIAIYRGKEDKHEGDAGYNLITTPDRETADLFYRLLQTYPDIDTKNKYHFFNLQRHSAQMWTFQTACCRDDLRELVRAMTGRQFSITDERFRDLVQKVVIQHYDSNRWFDKNYIPIIPHIDLADHISGGEFFIRRKYHPSQFWYLDNDWIRISENQSTKFRLELVNNSSAPKDALLIGSDEVRIVALNPSSTTTIGSHSVHNGALGSKGDNETFKFSAFRNQFNLGLGTNLQSDYVKYVTSRRLLGEEWELIN
ncbi:hypothetical protein BDV39DRAFT_206800 [Aspergillus sergii]|uniref:Uncharacterized protein n=1 Tax=Aspergillus sergii TaxID=1034303 RepID=A0A5N6WYM5_9EURO|nr:hypothetical protein BDV39DRAFT_206800 [Aspergillus sergii]